MMKTTCAEKSLFVATIILVAFMLIVGINTVMAADQIISGKISTVTQKISKNGEAYVIIAIPEQKELSGIKYTTDTSIFCFKNEPAKLLKAGDSIKLIAKRTVSKDGNEFVTLIHILPEKFGILSTRPSQP